MQGELKRILTELVSNLFGQETQLVLSRPEERFGDYATNVAMQLAPMTSKNPKEIAEALVPEIQKSEFVADASVAGLGFINIKLKDEVLVKAAESATDLPKSLKGQQILVEFGDANPFKEMHIGHLYTSIIGDAIGGVLELAGAKIERLSYHGDVGMHVAKWIWGVGNSHDWKIEEIRKVVEASAASIGEYYAKGAQAFEQDDKAKAEIQSINESVYKKDREDINQVYQIGKEQSFRYFDNVFKELGIKYSKRYLESEAAETGIRFVNDQIGSVFAKSEGAVIYDGKKIGLHTRVFITSQGLPTYEAKDLGLAELKNKDYPEAEKSLIITAHEQSEYFKVMLSALAGIDAKLARKTVHLPHGFVSLSTGKMSSREGNVYSATDLIEDVRKAVKEQFAEAKPDNKTDMAALKYEFLKHRLGSDISFDVKQSVSLEGNSGPYLQYAHARACSILNKGQTAEDKAQEGLDPSERTLARKISEYPEVIDKAANELMPHHICTYLYELAQSFNSFYEKARIIGDEREAVRLQLVKSYAAVLKNGLELLNIVAPEQV